MSTKRNRADFFYGKRGKQYGIWNGMKKEFQFGICEDSPMLAQARLFFIIGDDARKWRFETKEIPAALIDTVRKQTPKHVRERMGAFNNNFINASSSKAASKTRTSAPSVNNNSTANEIESR